MRRHLALLALVAAAGCGLDAFSWGGGESCSVNWLMWLEGPDGEKLLVPRIEEVEQRTAEPGNIDWIAWLDPWFPDPVLFEIRAFRLGEVTLRDPESRQHITINGHCTHDTSPATGRDADLQTYACDLAVLVGCFPRSACEDLPDLQSATMYLGEIEACDE